MEKHLSLGPKASSCLQWMADKVVTLKTEDERVVVFKLEQQFSLSIFLIFN
jgi:hypothetical protein